MLGCPAKHVQCQHEHVPRNCHSLRQAGVGGSQGAARARRSAPRIATYYPAYLGRATFLQSLGSGISYVELVLLLMSQGW